VPSSSQFSSAQPSIKTPLSEQEVRDNARKIVATDLKTLQEKFAKAADEGSDELDERITEITYRFVQNQAQSVGEAYLIQMEETIKSELKSLKISIISIIKKSSDTEASEKDLTAAVRKAGSAIKDKAQAIRAWRKNYDAETNALVSQAATDTFEIIDHIRDLGLQEIGMRWAWTEGITHKDWSKYHAMKTKFDEWRKDVEEVATSHPGLARAREASEDVENRAMAMAEDAVKELARLKETGRWKLSTGDTSDDFSTKYMPAAAAVAGQKILDKVSEAVAGTSQGTVESMSSVAISSMMDAASTASSVASSQAENIQSVAAEAGMSASSAASSMSSSILGTPQGSVESIISVAKSNGSSLADQASSSIIDTQQGSAESIISVAQASATSIADKSSSSVIGTQQGSAESIISIAQVSANSIADKASSSVIGTSQGSMESIASVASDSLSSVAAKMSSSVFGTEPGVVEKVSSSISSVTSADSEAIPVEEVQSSASSLSSVASPSLSSGSSKAAKDASSISSSAWSAASSASSSLSTATSSALSKASKSASSISKDASSSASSESSTASKKVWGGAVAQFVEAKQIIYEDVLGDDDDASYSEKIQSMASKAGDKFSDLTKAVSEALLKPTSPQGSVESVTSLAAEQYSKALSAASVAYYGTQQGTGESIASVASSRYADAVAA
jgi:hypothetical protein